MKKKLVVEIFLLGVLVFLGFLFVYKGMERQKLPRLTFAPAQIRDSEFQSGRSQNLGGQVKAQTYDEIKNIPAESLDNVPILPSMGVLPEKENEVETEKVVLPVVLPEEFNLAVPFTSQAPFEIWDDLHEEACEETALIMLDAFYKNKTLTKQSAEDEVQKLVQWEIEKFGYFKDTTAEESVLILKEYFGYANACVAANPTLVDIKQAVFQGNPVILPTAGRLLGNRYFHTPGPIYHMLVVRGWTKDGTIITNDPGTKHGENYLYKPEVLMNAIHDWNAESIENGGKVMIVIKN